MHYRSVVYPISLHAALPIFRAGSETRRAASPPTRGLRPRCARRRKCSVHDAGIAPEDRKNTRLNSSHSQISYAVFCLKKKKNELVEFSYSPAATPSAYISID